MILQTLISPVTEAVLLTVIALPLRRWHGRRGARREARAVEIARMADEYEGAQAARLEN